MCNGINWNRLYHDVALYTDPQLLTLNTRKARTVKCAFSVLCSVSHKAEGFLPLTVPCKFTPFPSSLSAVCILPHQRRGSEDLIAGGSVQAAGGPGAAAQGGVGIAQLDERGQAGRDR